MKSRCIIGAIVALGVCCTAFAQKNDIAKFDPALVVKYATAPTNGVKWIDGKYLPIEGKAFSDVEFYYDRLPSNVTEAVNHGVRSLKHLSTGLQFRFRTDSKRLHFKWRTTMQRLALDHMPATGVSGIDVYRQLPNGRWVYVKTGGIWDSKIGGSLRINWTPGEACLVNLPIQNGIKKFELGLDENASITALGPRKSGVDKPVVFYGTSITHGCCCSRPGMTFVNIVGRQLDVPVVNLGFAGFGLMELEMSEHLAKIDASCYVLDCIWNMDNQLIGQNYEVFVRNLRSLRPGVPILMAEDCVVFHRNPTPRGKPVKALYDKLIAEGWKELYWLGNEKMYNDDCEGTVDGCHPTDYGMMMVAKAFGGALKEALKLK